MRTGRDARAIREQVKQEVDQSLKHAILYGTGPVAEKLPRFDWGYLSNPFSPFLKEPSLLSGAAVRPPAEVGTTQRSMLWRKGHYWSRSVLRARKMLTTP
jgi:hypothetical protein